MEGCWTSGSTVIAAGGDDGTLAYRHPSGNGRIVLGSACLAGRWSMCVSSVFCGILGAHQCGPKSVMGNVAASNATLPQHNVTHPW
jgi:hypothetical protein